ncbi:MAG: hypothetical protein ACLU6Z_14900 [Odoribacter splanchnicus]
MSIEHHSLETALNDPCLKREVLLLKANGLKAISVRKYRKKISGPL